MWSDRHRQEYKAFLIIPIIWLNATKLIIRSLVPISALQPTVPIKNHLQQHRQHSDNIFGRTNLRAIPFNATHISNNRDLTDGNEGIDHVTDEESRFGYIIPPRPRREENRSVLFGIHSNYKVSIPDPFGWMRDDSRTNPEVQKHIEAENAYTKQVIHHLRDLKVTLETEFRETMISSEPDIFNVYFQDDYIYYTKRTLKQPYAIHCGIEKKCPDQDAVLQLDNCSEEVLLDENELATNLSSQDGNIEFLAVHTVLPSPSRQKIAFTVDTNGDEYYTLFVRDMDAGVVTTIATNTTGNFAWGGTDHVLHYVCYDLDTRFRPSRWMQWSYCDDIEAFNISCHRDESNDRYWCKLELTSDGKFLLWKCHAGQVSNIWAMDLSKGETSFIDPFWGRDENLDSPRYDIDHGSQGWWMVSNHLNGDNNIRELYLLRDGNSHGWQKVHLLDVEKFDTFSFLLESMHVFSKHIVLYGRNKGLTQTWILDLETIEKDSSEVFVAGVTLEFDEPVCYLSIPHQQGFSSGRLVLSYESMLSPPQVWDISLSNTTDRRILCQKRVSGYNRNLYACERQFVLSRDGVTKIPISVLYHRASIEQRPCPLHLFGYGAYGHSLDPSFSTIRLPLLNRGVICVISHGRGGGEYGRKWHDEGSFHHKITSIHDFVDVAAYLVEKGITCEEKLGIEGRSAGGILVAGSLNENPTLFKTALLVAPFLDPLISMGDASLPLTTLEYSEWGDPNCERDFEIMRQWSPLQNIKIGKTYPSVLAIGGIFDPRVQYFDLLKYVATLRYATNDEECFSRFCVSIETSVGHSSGGNQQKHWDRLSAMYAFFLDQIGATKSLEQDVMKDQSF
jgi:oligopeptidase B